MSQPGRSAVCAVICCGFLCACNGSGTPHTTAQAAPAAAIAGQAYYVQVGGFGGFGGATGSLNPSIQ